MLTFLVEKDIPASLLPPAGELDTDEAVGTLKAYAFIAQREDYGSFDVHRLVRLATRNWVDKRDEKGQQATKVMGRVAEEYPLPKHKNRDMWVKYLPHAQVALGFRGDSTDKEAERELLFNVGGSFRLFGTRCPARTVE